MSEYWQCTSCGKFNYAGHPDDGCIHCGKLAIPSVCPTCGFTREEYESFGICADPWHEQVSTGAISPAIIDEVVKEPLFDDEPPIPGEVDPLDALIAKWRRHETDSPGGGVIHVGEDRGLSMDWCADELEQARAAHDALVSRRAREEALGFLGALVDKWRDKAKILRHSDPLTANRGDGVSWCAGDLQAALADPESGNWLKPDQPIDGDIIGKPQIRFPEDKK